MDPEDYYFGLDYTLKAKGLLMYQLKGNENRYLGIRLNGSDLPEELYIGFDCLNDLREIVVKCLTVRRITLEGYGTVEVGWGVDRQLRKVHIR